MLVSAVVMIVNVIVMIVRFHADQIDEVGSNTPALRRSDPRMPVPHLSLP